MSKDPRLQCPWLSSPQLTCAGGLCTTPESGISACPHATLRSTGLVIAVVTGEDKLLCVEEAAAFSLGIGRGARVSTVHCVCERGRREEGGGWRVEGGGWREVGEGWRVEGGGWREEGGGRRVEGGGWREEDGGRREGGGGRVEGGRESYEAFKLKGIKVGKCDILPHTIFSLKLKDKVCLCSDSCLAAVLDHFLLCCTPVGSAMCWPWGTAVLTHLHCHHHTHTHTLYTLNTHTHTHTHTIHTKHTHTHTHTHTLYTLNTSSYL